MAVLGIESSAHTLGIGIADGGRIVANVKRMYDVGNRGMIPSKVADFHAKNIGSLLKETFAHCGLGIGDIDAIGYTKGPGIGSCLRIGQLAARALSEKYGLPLFDVNHAVAHIEITKHMFKLTDPLVLYVSGGNSQILAMEKEPYKHYHVYGETFDIGVGNMFDSFARSAGLDPAWGSSVARVAEGGNYLEMPYTVKGMDFTFTGLLTHAIKMLKTKSLKDVTYSLQETAFSMLCEATERALLLKNKKELALCGGRAQIALEFVIVYSFILILFVLVFTLISTQRAASMSQQEYSLLQLQSQNIADCIDQALGAGSGYAATIPLAGSIGIQQYNISISTTGVVIAQTKVGTQIIKAFAFSNARNMIINGTPTQSGNGITVYLVPIQSGSVSLTNSNGAIYIDSTPASVLSLAKSQAISTVANVKMASFNGASSYINAGSGSSLNAQSSVTITAWIYDVKSGVNQGIATRYYRYPYGLLVGADGNLMSSLTTTYSSGYYFEGAAVPLNKWDFVVTTWNQTTHTVTQYQNGVATVVGSTTANSLDYSSGHYSLTIGSQDAGSVQNFNGFIANVRLESFRFTPKL